MIHKNYIILEHRDSFQLKKLVERLDDGFSFFYIHVDKKVGINNYKNVKELRNVFFVTKREPCYWGDFSLVQATLNALQQIIDDKKYYYTILLSGQCYPILDNAGINSYLEKNASFDHIDIAPVEEVWKNIWKERIHHYRVRLGSQPKDVILLPYFFENGWKRNLKNILKLSFLAFKRMDSHFIIMLIRSLKKRNIKILRHYGGSQWWGISAASLIKINDYIKSNKEVIKFYKDSNVPDEMFFHSILKNLSFKDPDIKMKPSLTYVSWPKHNAAHPITFNTDNLQEILEKRKKDKLFARKFDAKYCNEIMIQLDNS